MADFVQGLPCCGQRGVVLVETCTSMSRPAANITAKGPLAGAISRFYRPDEIEKLMNQPTYVQYVVD